MVDSNTTLLKLVDEGRAKYFRPLAMACKYGSEWRETTVDQFHDAVREIALGLYDLGVRHGDAVALHAENRTEWLMADLAVMSVGAISVPVYTTQPQDQIRYIVEHAEAKVLVVSGPKLYAVSGPATEGLGLIATIGLDGAFLDGVIGLDDLRARGRALGEREPGLFAALKAAVKPSDTASITYTSGTTGVPKGVVLSHSNLCHTILAARMRGFHTGEIRPQDQVLSFLPYTHIFEHCAAYGCMANGLPMYITPTTDNLLADIQYVRPTHFATVPRLLEKVYGSMKTKAAASTGVKGKIARWALKVADRHDPAKKPTLAHRIADRLVFAKFRDAMGGRIRGITSGGAALSPDICRFFIAIGVPVGEGYGLTETSPGITMYMKDSLRPGTVGKPLEDVEVRIAEDGEILCRGPNVMQGYYKMPEQTREVIEPDGWFHTGDIGHIDEDGYLHITDRKKELFKLSTGKYVAPAPVENRLMASALVEQVAVVGNNCKFCGALIHPNLEAMTATIGHSPTKEEVRKLLEAEIARANEGIPPWEQVKNFAVLAEPMTVESGELTPTMKRKRAVINTNRKADIDSIYAGDDG